MAGAEGVEKLEDVIVRSAEQIAGNIRAAREAVSTVIFGQERVVENALVTILSGGHALLIGVPGLAKTKLVETLGITLGLDAKRVQFTPDLMPSDILGAEVLDESVSGKRSFRFISGPVFAQLLMADEINRASPRTQSALLQAMQEQHITVAGARHDLPKPFHVLATQNPLEQEGTYPLPEAELDRFMLKLRIDYPAEAEEQTLVRQVTRSARSDMLDVANLRPLLKDKDVLALQRIASDLPIDDQVLDYAVRLARTTRNWPGLALGAGPRASIALVRCGRARALLRGGEFVVPDDIKGCALAVLRHRVRLSPELDIEGLSVDQVLQQLLDQVPAPRV